GTPPGMTPPTPTGPRAGPASRAAWSTGPDGPAPRRPLRDPAVRSIRSPSPPRLRAAGLLHGQRLSGDNQHHPVAQPGQPLVEAAQLVGEPTAGNRLRHHGEAHL